MIRGADDVDVVGAIAAPQADAGRRRFADPPAGGDRPRIRTRGQPALQPAVGRGGDEQFVVRWRRGEVTGTQIEQSGVEASGGDIGVGQQEPQEFDVGAETQDGGVGQRAIQAAQRRGPVLGVGDDLGQHRVVVAADRRPAAQPRIDPQARAGGLHQPEHRSAGGQEPGRGVLGVHPRLDGVPVHLDVVLRGGQLLPRRNADLPLDEVPAGDHLGDRVLDLQAGVHLHEEELVGVGGGDDELHRSGADVVDAAGGVAGRRPDPRPGGRVEQR